MSIVNGQRTSAKFREYKKHIRKSKGVRHIIRRAPRNPSDSSSTSIDISEKWPATDTDDTNLTTIISDKTENVLRNEQQKYKIGRILWDYAFHNDSDTACKRGSGTLIDNRLVLTCAHFFHCERKFEFEIEIQPNQDPGIQMELCDKEENYFVADVSQTSPCYGKLQIGDIVCRVQIHNPERSKNQWETTAIQFLTDWIPIGTEKWKIRCIRRQVRKVCFCLFMAR